MFSIFTHISFDAFASKQLILGNHEKPIRSLVFIPPTGLIASGSWDSFVKLWDPRAQHPLQSSIGQPGKVFSMDVSPDGRHLVVGTQGRHVHIFDVRKGEKPLLVQRRESSLKHQTRCIRCSTDNSGYALSSIEARVAIEYFDPSEEVQKHKYAFKCHRVVQAESTMLYPVNAIAFHPTYVENVCVVSLLARFQLWNVCYRWL